MGDDVGTSVWKQELEMELTGSHVHLKLHEDRTCERTCVRGRLKQRTSLPDRVRGEVWVVRLLPVQ